MEEKTYLVWTKEEVWHKVQASSEAEAIEKYKDGDELDSDTESTEVTDVVEY